MNRQLLFIESMTKAELCFYSDEIEFLSDSQLYRSLPD